MDEPGKTFRKNFFDAVPESRRTSSQQIIATTSLDRAKPLAEAGPGLTRPEVRWRVVYSLVGAFGRMAFRKFNPNQAGQSKSDFKRQMDIILWALPAMIALSAAWYLVEAIFQIWHR